MPFIPCPRRRQSSWLKALSIVMLLFMLTACTQPIVLQPSAATPVPMPTFTPTPQAEESTAPADTEPATVESVEPTPTVAPPITVAISPLISEQYRGWLMLLLTGIESLETADGVRPLQLLDRPDNANLIVTLTPLAGGEGIHLLERFYAPVVPFATVRDETSMQELAGIWRGESAGVLIAPMELRAEMTAFFGPNPGPNLVWVRMDELLPMLEANPGSIGFLPFDHLHPRYKVLTVDGFNVLSNQLDAAAYPLALALTVEGNEAAALTPLLTNGLSEPTNRQADRLTTLIMTGVTAMSRVTALRMEQRGYTYPALIISDTLSAADITHISNEVPFLDNCVVDASVNNLVLCSHTNYWATLEAIGTTIVGLSGNHVNDFGREGARRSLTWYRENNIPIYGSGMNVDEACEPLLWEHNGNTFAFFAALAFYPEFAWATADLPGACYYFTNKQRILDKIVELRDQVDVIAVELQHTEIYDARPFAAQISDFRELRDLGVDIVTGVQSHVPQAAEPYEATADRPGSVINYGLGNLFFDQMWSWETRTGLMARHTIYNGELLSTEILTTVLEDYAQPRWATPEERREILNRIFNAAPARP
ncbi:MAG: CapA family protein [Caldilineaceae bacterium]|nr:CapA family protein [Caldilineaceae bacterium]